MWPSKTFRADFRPLARPLLQILLQPRAGKGYQNIQLDQARVVDDLVELETWSELRVVPFPALEGLKNEIDLKRALPKNCKPASGPA